MAIVARWEWRVFGKGDFGEAEKMIRALPMDSNKKTEEEYILSRKSDENVKIGKNASVGEQNSEGKISVIGRDVVVSDGAKVPAGEITDKDV